MIRFIILTLLILPSLTPAWAGQGWYLMLPPMKSECKVDLIFMCLKKTQSSTEIDSKAPLALWEQNKSFSSSEECEAEKNIQLNMANGFLERILKNRDEADKKGDEKSFSYTIEAEKSNNMVFHRWEAARCIASDDPRLK